MLVRRFIRPFAYGGRLNLAANTRSNLMRHNGGEQGRITFDGFYYNRATIGSVATRFLTDCESALDFNDGWGATEGGIHVPWLGEADAARPFYLDAEDLSGSTQILGWYLLGYVGGELVEDDGFFEPPRGARHFCESSVRGGVSCPNGVPTAVLTFDAPDALHGIRVTRIDLPQAAPPGNFNLTFSIHGPGVEPYKQLAFMHVNSFAQPHWLPLIARLEPRRRYTVEVLRSQIGSANYGAVIHGWAW